MNELLSLKNMMSSKQIAERTGKQHSNVLRDIRNMLDELVESQDSNLNSNEYQELTAKNSMTSEILLNERLSLCLASGYSITLRMMIIDDWAKMKNELPMPKELSRLEILTMAIESERKVIELESKIEQDRPKVVFADSVIGSSNSILIRQFAKDLCDENFEIGQNRLFEWFRENKYLNDNNEPYQDYVSQGYFEVITRAIGSGTDTFTSKTTKITGRGAVYFSHKIKNK